MRRGAHIIKEVNMMQLKYKCEWLHSQIQEAQNGVEVDFEMMLSFVEDVREYFLNQPEKELTADDKLCLQDFGLIKEEK